MMENEYYANLVPQVLGGARHTVRYTHVQQEGGTQRELTSTDTAKFYISTQLWYKCWFLAFQKIIFRSDLHVGSSKMKTVTFHYVNFF